MLKLGMLNADLDVSGAGSVEEVQLFRLTDAEKRDFEKKLPGLNALVADLNLINIDSFRFLKGFTDQLTERVREGGLLLCFTSRPNLHSPDGIQNKYSWLPLFDEGKEVREDLVDKIKPGESANGVSGALGNLIDTFYATCSFPDGFGTDPYETLLQGEDGLPVGLAKPLGKGWILLIPQAEEKNKVLESALQWWDDTLSGAGSEDEPVAADDDVDNEVKDADDDSGEIHDESGVEPIDLGKLEASAEAPAEAPAEADDESDEAPASLEDLQLETGADASDALESANEPEGGVADLADLQADAPEQAAEDSEAGQPEEAPEASARSDEEPGDDEPEAQASEDESIDLAGEDEPAGKSEDLESVPAPPAPEDEDEFAAAGVGHEPVDLDTGDETGADSDEAEAAADAPEESPEESDALSAEDKEMISALKVLLGREFDEISALPLEKLREIYESHVEEARRKVFEGARDELSELLESAENSEDTAEPDEDDEEAPGASIDDIGIDVPSAPAWMDEFKAKVPGISDIVEEAEKLESEARRLLDQAGELRGRVDALSRWDPLLYLNEEPMAEELGEFFHVVLGADVSIEDDLEDGRPALKLLSAEGDFLVHVATAEDPISEDVGRVLMRALADVDIDTKGMLVLNGSLGRTPPRNPEEHAQKKLIKLAGKRGLLIVTVNQLYRLGLKSQQDEDWDAEPVLEELAEQSGLFEMDGDKD